MRPYNTRQSATNARQNALARSNVSTTDENSVDSRLTRSKAALLDSKPTVPSSATNRNVNRAHGSANVNTVGSENVDTHKGSQFRIPEKPVTGALGGVGALATNTRRRAALRDLSSTSNSANSATINKPLSGTANSAAGPGFSRSTDSGRFSFSAGAAAAGNKQRTEELPNTSFNRVHRDPKIYNLARSAEQRSLQQRQPSQPLTRSRQPLASVPSASSLLTRNQVNLPSKQDQISESRRQERLAELKANASKLIGQDVELQSKAQSQSQRPSASVIERDTSSSIYSSKLDILSKPSTGGLVSKRSAFTDVSMASRLDQPIMKKPKLTHSVDSQETTVQKAPVFDEELDIAGTSDQEWDDLDAEDKYDPMMVSEYVVEIFDYLYKTEKLYMPDPNYFAKQSSFTPRMRGVLMDWIIQVQLKFRLLPETLFLATNIIDRFLSKKDAALDQVQLFGIAALFIACKMEEVISPSVGSLAYLAEGYTEEEIIEAELLILRTLNYENSFPNPLNFLRRISKADDYDIPCRTIGKYFTEIAVVHHKLLEFAPSAISAAAMYLSRHLLNRTPTWNANLVHYSGGYTTEDLAPIVDCMMQYLVAPVAHEEFFKKYASKKYFKASIRARTWAKEQKRLQDMTGGN